MGGSREQVPLCHPPHITLGRESHYIILTNPFIIIRYYMRTHLRSYKYVSCVSQNKGNPLNIIYVYIHYYIDAHTKALLDVMSTCKCAAYM
jgi:hypothetical protein